MRARVPPKRRFATGAKVNILMPGLVGTVVACEDRPGCLGEYWHKIDTEHGERNEPGSNIELIPAPIGGPVPSAHTYKSAPETMAHGAAGFGARMAQKLQASSQLINWGLIHQAVREVSESRFSSGHFADSVEASLKAVNERVREIVKRLRGEERDGANLMFYAFDPDSPVLQFGDSSKSGKDEQKGYQQIFAGAMTGIRNPKAHANVSIDAPRAVHLIFLASLLMFKLDEASEKPTTGSPSQSN